MPNEFPKEKDFLWTSVLLLVKYYLSKQIKKNGIGIDATFKCVCEK